MVVRFRSATPDDAPAVAALHADSWRRHYRGAYADEYLDGPIDAERLEVWSGRLEDAADTATILAEDDGGLVGFVHVVLDADDTYGALVDNLHVRHDVQRSGLGAQLMAHAAAAVVRDRPTSQLHLWVLEQNTRAQGFYRALGGVEADRKESTPPGGGRVTGIRFVWPSPLALQRRSR